MCFHYSYCKAGLTRRNSLLHWQKAPGACQGACCSCSASASCSHTMHAHYRHHVLHLACSPAVVRPIIRAMHQAAHRVPHPKIVLNEFVEYMADVRTQATRKLRPEEIARSEQGALVTELVRRITQFTCSVASAARHGWRHMCCAHKCCE